MKKILIHRSGGLGDLIMLTAAVWSYQEVHPDTEVYLFTAPQHVNLFQGLIYKDVFSSIPTGMTFDKYFELTGAVEAPQVGGWLPWDKYMGMNRIDIFEELLGLTKHPPIKFPMIRVNTLLVDKMKERIQWEDKYFWLVIQTTCATPIRTPPPGILIELSRMYKDTKVRIVYTGGEAWLPSEAVSWYNNGRNLIGKLTQEEYIALISVADGVIAPDSSGPHISAALNKMCIALFGNIDPYTRVHYYPTVKALYPKGALKCIPCGDTMYSECQKDRVVGGKCLRLIDPVKIFKESVLWFGLGKRGFVDEKGRLDSL